MSRKLKNVNREEIDELLKATQLQHLVKDIKKEKNAVKVSELVQSFHKALTDEIEIFEEKQKENNTPVVLAPLQYFWVELDNTELIKGNSGFQNINAHVFKFEKKKPKEIIQEHLYFQTTVGECFNKLKKTKQFRIINTMNNLFEFDKTLSIWQGSHKRNSIRETPIHIIDLVANGLRNVNKVPDSNSIELTKALLDIIVDIFQLPDKKGWTWLIKVILIDALKVCQSLKEPEQQDYKKLVAWMNLIFLVFLLEMYEEDLHVGFNIIQILTPHQLWTIPSHYIYPMGKMKYETDSKPLNVLEVSCIQFYKLFMKVNKWALDQESKMKIEDEIFVTYRLALSEIMLGKPDDGILVLYELVKLCYDKHKPLFLFIAYLHLSHCFFVLRQTHTAILYLELVCQMGKIYDIFVLDMLAHKQQGLIAACQFDYKISIFHFEKALEIATKSNYLEVELYHEIDDLKNCLGEVIAKYKMTQTRFALDEPLDIGQRCTCFMYENYTN